jgi:SAM-dependent methyltransferase
VQQLALRRGETRHREERKRFAASVPLRREDFTCLAKAGFGDGYNGISHSMSYFHGKIYVGTSRANLQMIAVNKPPSTRVWPVKCPANVYELDRRAQIQCFDPEIKQWSMVYQSPFITGDDGTPNVPQDMGYRGQAIFKGKGDKTPVLYVCTWSPSKGLAPMLLRSEDGQHFERVGTLGSGDRSFNTFRTLYAYGGRLFTSPTGRTAGYGLATDCMAEATLYVTDDPASGTWRAASEPGFGDPTNLTVFEVVQFADHLYVGTVNATTGYQVWKTKAEGEPPYAWTKVIDQGAYRGKLNEMAVSMTVFNGALYVGSGIQNGGYDKVHQIGPAGAELIRIHPDDSWELIVGSPRHTPAGYKRPLSDIGPGFGSLFNAHIWRGVVHDGYLYLATYNWVIFLPFLTGERWPEKFKKRLKKWGIHNLIERRGGFDLWRSRDGLHWKAVSLNGFGNPYNYGIRTMVSTKHGLFLGTANTFGPEVAVKLANGEWTYTPNPAGGTEVWLGAAPPSADEFRDEVDPVEDERNTEEAPDPVPAAKDTAKLSQQARDLQKKYDVRMYDSLVDEYYGGSGFYSWGLWNAETETQAEACMNMMEELAALIPDKRGNILDVGCGQGATSKFLLRHYEPPAITGIDISDKLMESCRRNAPGAQFMVMDAVNMDFDDETFDNVLCVDAAGLFDTRERFIQEAFCVLKPGGGLVLSDRLLSHEAVQRLASINRDNYVHDLKDYEDLFRRNGFVDVRVHDMTDRSLWGYADHFSDFLCRKYREGKIEAEFFNAGMGFILSRMVMMKYYVFVSARKPVGMNDQNASAAASDTNAKASRNADRHVRTTKATV